MSLKEYSRKRKFDKTPEPKPEIPAQRESGRFYIQRHDATRLHYDFRLEFDGVLVSWAVPKGPSLEPLSKNLAVHVEDHPLDYGNFEGNIPKGNYGAGSVMLWDRGTFELIGEESGAEQISRGDLKFHLHGEKLKGTFALVHMKGRGKGNDWLIIKKRDEFAVPGWDIEGHARSVLTGRTQEEIAKDLPPVRAPAGKKRAAAKKRKAAKPDEDEESDPSLVPGAREAAMPDSITPMSAVLASRPPSGDRWLYEVKWDGIRAICFVRNGEVKIQSRRGNPVDRQFPELSVLPHFVKASSAIIDGEIAMLDPHGRSSFALIQPRISVTDPNSISHLARKTPAVLFAFDLLYADGYDLRGAPLTERKRLLRALLQPADRIHISDHFQTDGATMLEAARAQGLEGLMAKRADSVYEPRRSDCWVKVKIVTQQEFAIVGFTQGEREFFGALALGVYRDGRLEYAGNVGTGFDQKMVEAIYRQLEPLIIPKSPLAASPDMPRKVTWVKPELVCEVKFSEWTRDGRLRAPVFLGLRIDVDARDAVAEIPAPDRTDLLTRGKKELSLTVDGRPLKFTNLDKVFYPAERYTKRDVINYYDAVAHLLVPHLAGRPLSLKRYPNGIEEQFFFQKDMPEHTPDWLRTVRIPSEHRGEPIRFVVADDRATLLYLANLGCIDQNPWMSRIESLDYPDWALIDLDPTEGAPYELLTEAAALVHSKLDQLGLSGYPKTTGGDGIHVYVPLEPRYTYEQVRTFAELLFHLVFAESPNLFTTPRSVSKRKKGRVYFDYLQISSGKTIAAPYVLRAYPGAPVATPLGWDEVNKHLSPKQFHLGNAVERFEQVGDLFRGVLENRQALEPAIEKLGKLLRG